jgi:hypothetical protein
MFKIAVKKANASYDVDFDSMPEVSRNRVIVYGLTQLLSDAAATVALSANVDGRKVPLKGKELASAHIAAKKEADERLGDLFNGVLRRVRESGNPVESRARQIAIRQVQKDSAFRAWVAAEGVKFTDTKATEELAKRAGELVKSNPKIAAIAQRQIDDEAALSVDDESDVAEAA